MKQMKKIMYLIGVLAALGLLVLVGTAIVQIGMGVVATKLGIAMQEDFLYHISGSCGIVIVGAICAIWVKKKEYTNWVERKEPFRIKACAYYGTLTICICQVLFYAVTTVLFAYVFSMAEGPQLTREESWVDIVFAIVVAPIFEELLFRMGFYSLLRRRFKEGSSIVLCTIIFAATHGYSLQGFLACLTAGLVFMLIYARTGNIWYSIVAHMLCNLESSIMNALEAGGVTFMGIPLQFEVSGFNMVHPVFIIIAAVFCGVCVVRVKKGVKTENVPLLAKQ